MFSVEGNMYHKHTVKITFVCNTLIFAFIIFFFQKYYTETLQYETNIFFLNDQLPPI